MTYPLRNPRVATRTLDGEAVAVSPDDATLHRMNEVGSRIWELSDGSLPIASIAKLISEEFDVTPEQAEADVREYCRTLSERNILILNDSAQKPMG